MEIRIGNRLIGLAYPPLIIAEIGINHNGNLSIAKEMVDAAASVGCEIVKFQTHIISDEMSIHAKKIIPRNANVSIYDIMKTCSLSKDEDIELKRYVEDKNLIYLSTPFSRSAVERLKEMDVTAYKIGSGECNNYPLVNHIAAIKKTIICSTGMNTIKDIEKTVSIFKKYGTPYALLHCTNIYPTPARLVRLGAMKEMMEAFPNIIVGLSDHTVNNAACLAAISLGACIVERHFTDNKKRKGPDIACSMDTAELKQLIQWSREIFEMQGGRKKPTAEESPTIDFAFASVVSIRNIKKGERFSKDNIWVKRPGTGDFLARDFDNILGKESLCDISQDEQIKRRHIAL